MELFEQGHKRRMLAGQFIWFAAWICVTAVGLWLRPDPSGHGTHQQLGFPPCPSVMIFDRPCPGCGLTTSWTALLHGDLLRSFQAHALGPLLYFAFTVSAWLCFIGFVRSARLVTESKLFNGALMTVVVLFVAFGGIRMLLMPGFAEPSEKLLYQLARGAKSRS